MRNTFETTLNLEWTDYHTSPVVYLLCLMLALAAHSPLYFMKLQMKKPDWEKRNQDNLISDVNIITELPRATPVPVPTPSPKQAGWRDKLKALLAKPIPTPPPPKPIPTKVPDKLDAGPKQIDIQAKLNVPTPIPPKLDSKSGFQTNQPKLADNKTIELKPIAPLAAPLSSKKLGSQTDQQALKNNRVNFNIASNETLKTIGGSGPSINDASVPTIAVKTSAKASTEKFTAPPNSMADKGRMGAATSGSMGTATDLTLREKLMARDAAKTAPIAVASSRGGGAADVPSATKRDAGRFQSGESAPAGGGVASPSAIVTAPKIVAAPVKPKEKKSMFLITGPLKDRAIEKKPLPDYPAWAVAQGIEASVVLEFTVDPQGNVKENIAVRRTSGYPKLDEVAMKALRTWKFKELPEDRNEEQVGTITFNFSLN